MSAIPTTPKDGEELRECGECEKQTLKVSIPDDRAFSLAPIGIGIEKASITYATDDALAPEIGKNIPLIVDEAIDSYDGKGYYVCRKRKPSQGNKSGTEIVRLEALPEGGFSYVSYKTKPEFFKTITGIEILGKIRYFLERDESREEKPGAESDFYWLFLKTGREDLPV